ncbi:MAG: tRNA (N(6)-L-threonylcarbamoyladenosine(37)-C(2))-methylthiotransferase MtaB [Planctomycetota bacterium]|jgi:threonylcarbamoyladenosine tRNA methylthiotransferase MtaB
MNSFAINTLGCKVNQYESQQIREFLERSGLRQVDANQERPDLVVVNTCCVTQAASAKSRQCIRKAYRLSPDALIVVCGCLSTVQPHELSSLGKHIHVVSRQDDLALKLSQVVASRPVRRCLITPESNRSAPYSHNSIRTKKASKIKVKKKIISKLNFSPLSSFKNQTRAFLKIQDGCDACCSYCIVPQSRPLVRSKAPAVALQEAQTLVQAGHREIVVTGIHLGAYGQKSARRNNWESPENNRLADLLEKMAQIPGLARIRLSSLEPQHVTSKLLDTIGKYHNIMPHLHLSLQSGSDGVLRRMGRQYRAGEFVRTVGAIKSRLDRPAITTDIIVAFPGETHADFQQTVDLAREVGFAKMHVFSFSPRKGTVAAAMQDVVDNRVMKERSKKLREIDIELGSKFRQQFLGETATVLLENDTGQPSGRSERYFMVCLEKTPHDCRKNELVKAKLTRNSERGAFGQFIARDG